MLDRQVVIKDALLSLNICSDICSVVLDYTNPCPKLNKQGRRYKYFLKVTVPEIPNFKAYLQCSNCGVVNNTFVRSWAYFRQFIMCHYCDPKNIMRLEDYKKLLIKNDLPKPIKWYTRKGTKRLPNS